MRAWIVTWERVNQPADDVQFVALLPSRWSDKSVRRVVEALYSHSSATLQELVKYAGRPQTNPYRCEQAGGDGLTCGHNPYLYARKVDKLKVRVDVERGTETLSWTEPDRYEWRPGSRPEVVHHGQPNSIERPIDPD